MVDADLEFSIEKLQQYYELLFPSTKMFEWLSYHKGYESSSTEEKVCPYLFNREFSFTLEGDIYCRYECFKTEEELIKKLIEKKPIKIDLGAIYNVPPKQHSTLMSQVFAPQEKELVFDIDMTDYDDVRTCCSGAGICPKCWKFMEIAVEVVDRALREDFGFKNLLWVFSGRRGIHCWLCDEEARTLSNEGRTAIVEYLSVYVGNELTGGHAKLAKPIHPGLKRAVDIIKPRFAEIMISEQGVLSHSSHQEKMLDVIKNFDVRNTIKQRWESDEASSDETKWAILVKECEAYNAKQNKSRYPKPE